MPTSNVDGPAWAAVNGLVHVVAEVTVVALAGAIQVSPSALATAAASRYLTPVRIM
ncbi:MAG TPA: hypothetical protein VJT31_36935 [Rugosimonospora sp.]|nr:hypothetical protein [Rugosimonospora sp.]